MSFVHDTGGKKTTGSIEIERKIYVFDNHHHTKVSPLQRDVLLLLSQSTNIVMFLILIAFL
jgi:hypothetical protein